MIYLSKHFTLTELTRSQTAIRRGINNTPDNRALARLKALARNVLEPVRVNFGIPFYPSSGFRCPKLNRAVGSSSKSQHVKGEAVDFEIPGISNLELHNWIKDNLDVDQNILEFYDGVDPNSGWCHVSWVGPDDNRNMSFTIG